MKTMVSREKLSKKAQKALNAEKRVRWEFKPVTRVIPNKKKDAESKLHRGMGEDAGWSFFDAI